MQQVAPSPTADQWQNQNDEAAANLPAPLGRSKERLPDPRPTGFGLDPWEKAVAGRGPAPLAASRCPGKARPRAQANRTPPRGHSRSRPSGQLCSGLWASTREAQPEAALRRQGGAPARPAPSGAGQEPTRPDLSCQVRPRTTGQSRLWPSLAVAAEHGRV